MDLSGPGISEQQLADEWSKAGMASKLAMQYMRVKLSARRWMIVQYSGHAYYGDFGKLNGYFVHGGSVVEGCSSMTWQESQDKLRELLTPR